ncbi:hypothetical protein GCM10010299_21390 [Streptomyces tanashiensis]|nr:hypothetical protein GCM10010299_21390 [Streptomyces tanashiensis]
MPSLRPRADDPGAEITNAEPDRCEGRPWRAEVPERPAPYLRVALRHLADATLHTAYAWPAR